MEKHIQDGMEDETDQPQQTATYAFQLPLVPTHLPYHFPTSVEISQHAEHQQELKQRDLNRQSFWTNHVQEMKGTTNFKNNSLPLSRINKIMKADEDVKMIAAETPVLFSRACEFFIMEMTYYSWSLTKDNKRRALQKRDICSAIKKHKPFDFLIEIINEKEKDARLAVIPENKEQDEPLLCLHGPFEFGSLRMDMRSPEMVSRSFLFDQQHQEENDSINIKNSTSIVYE